MTSLSSRKGKKHAEAWNAVILSTSRSDAACSRFDMYIKHVVCRSVKSVYNAQLCQACNGNKIMDPPGSCWLHCQPLPIASAREHVGKP